MDPEHMPETRSVWLTLLVKITRREKWAWEDIFKPVEHYCPGMLVINWSMHVRTWYRLLYLICLQYSAYIYASMNMECRFCGSQWEQWCWRSSGRHSVHPGSSRDCYWGTSGQAFQCCWNYKGLARLFEHICWFSFGHCVGSGAVRIGPTPFPGRRSQKAYQVGV